MEPLFCLCAKRVVSFVFVWRPSLAMLCYMGGDVGHLWVYVWRWSACLDEVSWWDRQKTVALENLRNEVRSDPSLHRDCVTAHTPLREVAFWQRTMASFLTWSSWLLIQRTKNFKGETGLVCITSIAYVFSLNSLCKKDKVQMETIEGFANFVYFVDVWVREQAQYRACEHAQRTKNALNRHR